MKNITVAEVQYTAHSLATELPNWDEPIPPFETGFPKILESCIATPFITIGKKSMYKGLIGKAAILFYLMIKNHPFSNGNKRVAVATLLTLLFKNGKWLKVDNQNLYTFAVWIAESPAQYKDNIVQIIQRFIVRNLVNR